MNLSKFVKATEDYLKIEDEIKLIEIAGENFESRLFLYGKILLSESLAQVIAQESQWLRLL